MSHPEREEPRDLVPHPRFGSRVVPSGLKIPCEEIRGSDWRYERETLFPESAIEADLSRQSPSVVPCRYYVDILKECRACGRPFLFFAREQQYWYEVLGFPLEADCLECPKCRRAHRQEQQRYQRYSATVNRNDLTDAELALLAEDAVELFSAGRVPEQKLRRLKNLARERIPEAAPTQRILAAVSEIDQQRSADNG